MSIGKAKTSAGIESAETTRRMRPLYVMPTHKARRDLEFDFTADTALLHSLEEREATTYVALISYSGDAVNRLKKAMGGLLVFAMTWIIAPHASAEYVIELPVLGAIRSNNLGVFELMLMKWDQKPQPEPIELIRYNSRVRFGAGNLESIDQAFGYAVERTTGVRHSGTVSIFGHSYRPTNSDGPSAGAVMAVGFIAMFKGDHLQRGIAMTGTLEPGGLIGPVGSIPDKMRAAAREGYRMILVPTGQTYGPDWNLNQMAMELNVTVKAVETIDQAYELMTGQRI